MNKNIVILTNIFTYTCERVHSENDKDGVNFL